MREPTDTRTLTAWTAQEQLLLQVAQIGRRRRRRASALILAALTAVTAFGALAASTWTLCYAVTVDGVPVAACTDREEIAEGIRLAQAVYTSRDTVETHVSSRVDVSLDYVPAQTEVLDAEALAQRLTRSGGNLPEAKEGGLAVYAPEEEVWEEAQPLLDVTTVEEVSYQQPIPAPLDERTDETLLPGETQVLREGSDGLEERTERITLRCGVEQERETLSTVILTQPVARVVAVGTGSGPQAAEGRFQWPCKGWVSSPFGARHLFGGEDYHRGTDIAAPMGTDIVAAASGIVCWAGPKGTYGNLVQVDHGNGYVTRYGHCSELLVGEGTWVEQGQTIARVGSTGRSTGPHCHFEIRWQGEPFDPQTCLP